MKKVITSVTLLLTSFIFLFGCTETTYYKDIEMPELALPASCADYKNNACDTFSCIVDSCWCNDSPNSVISAGTGVITVESEKEAAQTAILILSEEWVFEKVISMDDVKNTIKLNDIFYNVFIEVDGEEKVYSVSVDGAVIETTCGV
jgi:hypothetical protein